MRTLLLIALVSGCSNAPTKIYSGNGSLVSLRLHNLTDIRDAHIIDFSAHLWDTVGAHIRLETEESGGELLDVYLMTDHIKPSEGCVKSTPTAIIDGCYDQVESVVKLDTMAENEFGCMAHELGHAIGLHHIPIAGSLMYYEAGIELTDADILAYDQVWGNK